MGRPALGQRIADRPAVSWRGGFRHPAPSKPQPSASATRCRASCPAPVRRLPSACLLSGRPGPTSRRAIGRRASLVESVFDVASGDLSLPGRVD
jgi:hypothetical protein